MPVLKVIRSAAGDIINIGDWDYQIHRVQATTPITDEETGEVFYAPVFDPSENGGYVPRLRQTIGNPLPDGAYEDTAEIVTGWDGGLYEASDPRRLGPGDSA